MNEKINEIIENYTADYFAAEDGDSFIILDKIYECLMIREQRHSIFVEDLIRELIMTKAVDLPQFERYFYIITK